MTVEAGPSAVDVEAAEADEEPAEFYNPSELHPEPDSIMDDETEAIPVETLPRRGVESESDRASAVESTTDEASFTPPIDD